MNVDYKLIGKRIKEIRREKGITQEQLSELLSVTVGYVSQIERGYTKPNLDMLAKICSLLECDLANIICGVVLQPNNYMLGELGERFTQLTPAQKKLVLDIIDSVIKNDI